MKITSKILILFFATIGITSVLLFVSNLSDKSVSAAPENLTLRPNADATYSEFETIFPVGGDLGFHWEKIDEEAFDAMMTYVYTNSAVEKKDAYTLTDGSGTGAIDNVTINVRSRGGCIRSYLYLNGAEIGGGGTTCKTYQDHSEAFSTTSSTFLDRPDGQPWEWSDINDLQVVVGLWKNASYQGQVGKVYVVVSYSGGTETLRPDGEGYIQEIEGQFGGEGVWNFGEHMDKVDEDAVNSDYSVTFIQSTTNGDREIFNLQDTAEVGLLATSTINKVTAYSRALPVSENATGTIRMIIKSGGVVWSPFGNSMLIAGTTWSNKGQAWSNNPITGSPWTIAELDNLQAGVEILSGGARISRVWVKIDHDEGTPDEGIKILKVNGNGDNLDFEQYQAFGAQDHYRRVYEAVADNESSYIESNNPGEKDTFYFSDSGIPIGSTVHSVTVHAKAKRLSAAENTFQFIIRSGGNDYFSGNKSMAADGWAEYSEQWLTDPFGGAWSLDDINNLEAGAKVINGATITQVWAVVNYTPNHAPNAPLNVKCEGASNPTGVTSTNPTLSAEYDDPDSADTANVYQCQVIEEGGDWNAPLWDSGTTSCAVSEGDRIEIVYGGAPLSSNSKKYYQKWKFWDIGLQGVWSSGSANSWVMASPPVFLPSVSTNGPTLVEETEAVFNGFLDDDGGEDCQYRFEYDTDSGEPYNSTTSWSGDTKTTGESFSQSVSGLLPGTVYYFRAQAQNSAGAATGTEKTFRAKPEAPEAFNVTSMDSTHIHLVWTPGAGAHQTVILRKEGSAPVNRSDGIIIATTTETSFTDGGLTEGATYYYWAWSITDIPMQKSSDDQKEDFAVPKAAPSLILSKSVEDPGIILPGDTTRLTLKLEGLGETYQGYEPVDVIHTIDVSGSMEWYCNVIHSSTGTLAGDWVKIADFDISSASSFDALLETPFDDSSGSRRLRIKSPSGDWYGWFKASSSGCAEYDRYPGAERINIIEGSLCMEIGVWEAWAEAAYAGGVGEFYELVIQKPPVRLDAAKEAATEFVNILYNSTSIDPDDHQIGVVSFDDNGDIEIGLTLLDTEANKNDVINAIDGLGIGGGTAIGEGIDDARNALATSTRDKIIILLSDGRETEHPDDPGLPPDPLNDNPLNQARVAAEEGIVIFTIGFGNADKALLEEIADITGGKYNYATGVDELKNIYQDIAENLSRLVASDMKITDIVIHDFEYMGNAKVNGIACDPDSIDVDGSTTTLVWDSIPGSSLDGIEIDIDEELIISFDIKAATTLGAGTYSVNSASSKVEFDNYEAASTIQNFAPASVTIMNSCVVHNVFGYGWSENIGWVSFSCTNCDVDNPNTDDPTTADGLSNGRAGCPALGTTLFDYGVNIDASGKFSGSAWSNSVGWISFNSSDLTGCPDGTCEARLTGTEVSGWARALSHGDDWDGWVKLKGQTNEAIPQDYEVSLNAAPTPNEFEGWAWGGNVTNGNWEEKAVVGWLSFNCSNQSSCGTSNYKVMTNLVSNQAPYIEDQIINPLANYCTAFKKKGQIGFEWEYKDDDPQTRYDFQISRNAGFIPVDVEIINNSPASDTNTTGAQIVASPTPGEAEIGYGGKYYWRVKVYNANGDSGWVQYNDPLDPDGDGDPATFSTSAHAWPWADWTGPSRVSIEEVANTVDDSICYDMGNNPIGCDSYIWTIPNEGVDSDFTGGTSATSAAPQFVFYSSAGLPKEVKSDVFDAQGFTCSCSKDMSVGLALPEWKEVSPVSWLPETLQKIVGFFR